MLPLLRGGGHHEGVESKFVSTSHDTLSVLKHPNGHYMKKIYSMLSFICVIKDVLMLSRQYMPF